MRFSPSTQVSQPVWRWALVLTVAFGILFQPCLAGLMSLAQDQHSHISHSKQDDPHFAMAGNLHQFVTAQKTKQHLDCCDSPCEREFTRLQNQTLAFDHVDIDKKSIEFLDAHGLIYPAKTVDIRGSPLVRHPENPILHRITPLII